MDKRAKEIKEFIKRHYPKAITGLALLFVLSLAFDISLKQLVIMVAFIVIGSFSTFYFNYARVPFHFETVKLGTILCAVAYDIPSALLVGLTSTFFGKVLIGRIDERLPISLLTITGVAVAAGIFSAANITPLGIILVLCYNITIILMGLLLRGNIAWNLSYEGSNFLVNLFWFTKIAPWLLPLIM
jgi:hypothetical protein